VFLFTSPAALADPPSADKVLTDVKARAAAEQKAVFVHFGASWCGWCKRLDAFLDRADIKPVFEKYFVPVKLVVLENGTNKILENPGADVLMEKLGGAGAGLPFSAFLAAQGSLIVNSKCPSASNSANANIGYPSEPAEVDWFVQMMRKAAPKMPENDLKTIETALRNSSFKPAVAAPVKPPSPASPL
jgi:hypothetical protein